MLIRRINARSCVSICGRPPNGRDFQRLQCDNYEFTMRRLREPKEAAPALDTLRPP
jgi:hypothetical protein